MAHPEKQHFPGFLNSPSRSGTWNHEVLGPGKHQNQPSPNFLKSNFEAQGPRKPRTPERRWETTDSGFMSLISCFICMLRCSEIQSENVEALNKLEKHALSRMQTPHPESSISSVLNKFGMSLDKKLSVQAVSCYYIYIYVYLSLSLSLSLSLPLSSKP